MVTENTTQVIPPTTGTSSNSKKSLALFEVGIDDNKNVFLPGQRVEGQLSMTLTQPTPITLLRIRFTGFISTHLYRNEDNLYENASTATLFKELQSCIGSTDPADKPVTLEAGEHIYPFSFRMPALQLPPSYSGLLGCVRYEVGAALIRPGHSNKTHHIVLTVPSTLDSQNSQYDDPVERMIRKSVGFWLWNSGHVQLRASLPRKAFASEETIPVTINILNQSNATLELLSVCLKQKTTCRTPDDTRGPKTERIHQLQFSETYLPHLKDITRVIQFPIPDTHIISPSIRTAILEVSHFIVIKLAARNGGANNKDSKSKRRLSLPWLKRKSKKESEQMPVPQIVTVDDVSNANNQSTELGGLGMVRSRSTPGVFPRQEESLGNNEFSGVTMFQDDVNATLSAPPTRTRSKSLDLSAARNSEVGVSLLARRSTICHPKVTTGSTPTTPTEDTAPIQDDEESNARYLDEVPVRRSSKLASRSHASLVSTTSSFAALQNSGESSSSAAALGHYLTTNVVGDAKKERFLLDRTLKVELPFVIGGFPHTIYDIMQYDEVETLPEYLEDQDSDREDDNQGSCNGGEDVSNENQGPSSSTVSISEHNTNGIPQHV